MGHDTLSLIIRTLGEFYVFLVILRFLLQMAQADFYNPISQAVYKLTQPPVSPLQKLLPRLAGRDFSALVLALLVKMLTFGLLFGLRGGFPEPVSLLVVSLVGLLSNILDIYFYAVIASVIISWVAPNSYHPAPQLINQLCEPVFNLARKVVPPIGGLDLSPILIFLVIQVIQLQLHRII
ncbi:YggT family protein [Motiliproteus sp. SC1-56]|uniref:YggT family protein n=1 Tax=Motiliproteus sp. SC1-56 TaxID=2799565 RepID=UPI001A9060E2|nr:YggT family protein [Motiliproteus sp. SC1-56]